MALEAENSLRLPSPTGYFNPSGVSVVNLSTWFWIDAGLWHPYSVTATVGSVSATAVATPIAVTWSTGDGGVTTCDGPGIPFEPEQPLSQQSTYCSHTYTTSSSGQPSPDGNPNDGAFRCPSPSTGPCRGRLEAIPVEAACLHCPLLPRGACV